MTPPPRRILEFGCGTGWLSLSLAQRGYMVLGVDIAGMPSGMPARRPGRGAGFTRHLVLPHPHQHHRLVCRRANRRAGSRAGLSGLWLLGLVRSLCSLLHWRKDPGLVVMWK